MLKKKAIGTDTVAGSRSMKGNLDTGIEVCDNKVKKNQRHTTNEKTNMYVDIINRGVEEVSHWHKYCCWINVEETKSIYGRRSMR